MDLWREWLWVIVGIVLVTFVISIIFCFINRCISSRAKHRITNPHLHKGSIFTINSNKYQERNLKGNTPPLPPRTQFLTAEAQSYENLVEEPDCERSLHDYGQNKEVDEQSTHDYEESKDVDEQSTHDYEESMPDYVQTMPVYVQTMPDYKQSIHDFKQDIPDYEQSTGDYVQGIDEPDYLKVEEDLFHPPPKILDPDPFTGDSSSEDYDDIGAEDENHDDEDYDDVG